MYEENMPGSVKLPESKLTLIPPYNVSSEELGKFVRCEIDEATLHGGNISADLEGDAVYAVCIDDLLMMLHHFLETGDMKEAYRHVETVGWELDDFLKYGDPEKECHNLSYGMRGLESDSRATAIMENQIFYAFYNNDGNLTAEDISELLRQAEIVKSNFGKSFEEREFRDEDKEWFLTAWDRNDNDEVNRATKQVQRIFKQFTEELAEKDNTTALHCLGYGCYTGCPMWGQDWIRSRDCFLKLMKLCPDNRFYANTLGYIYYYGRCNGGVPEYEEAYRYFSLAAFGGVYEAQYKVADMFEHGYGVVKNEKIAEEIINRLYGENIKHMYVGGYDCKFADVALRMSRIASKHQKDEEAYFYALQASFAIRQRMKLMDYYGDSSVAKAIEETLQVTREKLSWKHKREESRECLISLLYSFKNHDSLCKATITKLANGDAKLTIALFAKQKNERMLLTLPDVGFCGMTDKIVVTVKGVTEIKGEESKIIFDSVHGDSLVRNGETVLQINAARFDILPPKENAGNLIHFASVEFNPGGKPYDYICEDTAVAVGDKVTVVTKEGEQTVTVIRIFDKHESELSLPVAKYKKIEKK